MLCLGVWDKGRELEKTGGEIHSWILHSPSLPVWARKFEHRLGNENTGGKPHHLGECLCPFAQARPLGRRAGNSQMVLFLSYHPKMICSHLPGKPAYASQALFKLLICSWPKTSDLFGLLQESVLFAETSFHVTWLLPTLAWFWNDKCTLSQQTWKYDL